MNTAHAAYKGQLLGGSPAINFCNTVDARPGFLTREMSIEGEHLNAPKDFLDWAETAQIITAADKKALLTCSKAGQARLLDDAIALREALFQVFLAAVQKRSVNAGELSKLNEFLQSLPRPVASVRNKRVVLDWTPSTQTPHLIISKILDDALKILTSDAVARVMCCAAKDCGWVFIDHSKNNSRRWCDMADCGNRDKARRYARKAGSTA